MVRKKVRDRTITDFYLAQDCASQQEQTKAQGDKPWENVYIRVFSYPLPLSGQRAAHM